MNAYTRELIAIDRENVNDFDDADDDEMTAEQIAAEAAIAAETDDDCKRAFDDWFNATETAFD